MEVLGEKWNGAKEPGVIAKGGSADLRIAPRGPGMLVNVLLNGREDDAGAGDHTAPYDDHFRVIRVNAGHSIGSPHFNAVFPDGEGDGVILKCIRKESLEI
jgi:hypothetical protein